MLQQMIQFFTSAFHVPDLTFPMLLIAIGLALIFGAFWLVFYRPVLFKRPWLWVVAAGSAILTWTCIAFIQIPLQDWAGQAMLHFWSQQQILKWLLLAGIPTVLISGLVQEGAKMVPVVLYWWRNRRELSPAFGLIAGAVSGAGFGIFEAIWVHNAIFASGWNLHSVTVGGFMALLGFWERFFTIAFHIAVSALAGYGLSKRLGWQFYLIASALHGCANYSVVLLQGGHLTSLQVEIYIAVLSVIVTAIALWLRWRKYQTTPNHQS
ncbi:MAG TPA: PrsW family glutamic-type intramembrane protease [Dehalococcoidales bacterium]|nr:PrsW family glutamic-type intramembrane protease [Dehalococcoidales bacterium]